MRGVSALMVGLGLVGSGCSEDPEPFTVSVRGPLQGKAFAAPVTRVELRIRGTDGTERPIGPVDVTSGKFEVPDSAKSGIGALVLAGLNDTGATLEYGRTPSLELSGLSGRATLALSVFAQRKGALVDALALTAAVTTPRCATIGARYAVVADATSMRATVVDLLDLSARSESAFDRKPKTLATAGALTLVIDDAGDARLINLDKGTTTTPTGPFAEVNGGAVVLDDAGGAWLVGATRMASPTDTVLRLDPNGTIATRKLLRPRTAAAATWIAGRGLVISFGASPSMDEAGIEVIASDATASIALPYPSDHRPAGVVSSVGGGKLLRIDADGVATTVDLACSTACTPAASPIRDEPRPAREDDHVTSLEGGSSLVVRGGRVLHLKEDKLTLLHDAGPSLVCSAPLSTGNAFVMVAGESILRSVRP